MRIIFQPTPGILEFRRHEPAGLQAIREDLLPHLHLPSVRTVDIIPLLVGT